MRVMIPVWDDDHEAGEGAFVQIGGELREIDDLVRRSAGVVDDIAVPRRPVMAAVVGGTVVVIGSGRSAARCRIRLCVDLPGNSGVVQFTEDVVIGDGIGGAGASVKAIISAAVEIVRAGGQAAVGFRMTASGGEPKIIHERAAVVGLILGGVS